MSLLHVLTPKEINTRLATRLRVSDVHPGGIYGLWQLAGLWRVWSAAPSRDTWWIQPVDDTAEVILQQIEADPAETSSLVLSRSQGCFCVATKELKPMSVLHAGSTANEVPR